MLQEVCDVVLNWGRQLAVEELLPDEEEEVLEIGQDRVGLRG
jgi:hypothetical protein